MGNDDDDTVVTNLKINNMESLKDHYHGGTAKRKTPLQLEVLEKMYSEDRYPSHNAMDDIGLSIRLTYKQVRGWFIERRRREKREPCSNKDEAPVPLKSNGLLQLIPSNKRTSVRSRGHQDYIRGKKSKRKQRVAPIKKSILPLDFILKKVLRKDGPPLGVKFDPLPLGAFHHTTTKGSKNGHISAPNQRVTKKRKVSSPISDFEVSTKKSVSVMKHGMGKGLMTVWRATNPGAGRYPTGVTGKANAVVCSNPTISKSKKPLRREIQNLHNKLATKQGKLGNKLLERRKRVTRNEKVSSKKAKQFEKPYQEECKLALEGLKSQEYRNSIAKLVDDEELELRELQAGPNPLTCSVHLTSNGPHSCSLCKDLLARFPPQSVRMKQPLAVHPWGSSPELVKKLFKVFRFLCSQFNIFDICPFTLDEFAQAFHDKDSVLLGKIHVALLKVLFSDVEMELSGGFLPHASKDYRFVGFVQSVKQQVSVLKYWNRYLNPITWTEILRQVLIAAGFNSKRSNFRRELLNKDDNHLVEYGLRPGTLKAAMFSILSEQGNNGLKVSQLAKAPQVVELNLASTTKDTELLICSTLSSDITLFEKISPSAYRLRSNPLTNIRARDYQSDSEDSGSVDVAGGGSITNSSDESELDSSRTSLSIVKQRKQFTRKSRMLMAYTEMDESDSGELWVLALMEGEYSELSLEEKLNTLVALVDLMSAGSSIGVEAPASITVENIATIQHHGGAKIKRSSVKQSSFSMPAWSNIANLNSLEQMHPPSELVPVGSNCSTKKSDFGEPDGSKAKGVEAEKVDFDGHPLQSVNLGSDRRFNSYWLFLGPCNEKDPGHRRIYFESSEDGHWEVIDTKEALSSLLSVLDGRGSREACLLAALMRVSAFLFDAMSPKMTNDDDTRQSVQSDQSCIDVVSGDGSSPMSDVGNNLSRFETAQESFLLPEPGAIVLESRKLEEQKEKWERLQAFDAWIWNSFYCNLSAVKHSKRSYLDSFVRCSSCHDLYWRDEKHCRICHTTFELDFDLEEKYAIHIATCRDQEDSNIFPKYKVLSTKLQSLKAALHAIEGAMPKEALVSAWTMSDHKLWVTRLRRTSSLSELLQVLTDFVGAINEEWLSQCSRNFDYDTALDEIIVSFTRMPQTTSAVALWLVKLDALIAPQLAKVQFEQAQGGNTKLKRKLAHC